MMKSSDLPGKGDEAREKIKLFGQRRNYSRKEGYSCKHGVSLYKEKSERQGGRGLALTK